MVISTAALILATACLVWQIRRYRKRTKQHVLRWYRWGIYVAQREAAGSVFRDNPMNWYERKAYRRTKAMS